MAQDFAWKLRLTAALLGCTSRKDLCAAFRAANPATAFDLERAHKWLQGKALPRQASVYADWTRVLGTARSASWLASSARAAFLAELCALADADAATLEGRAAAFGKPVAEPARHYLCGDFMAYSHAWSPARRGQLIRGAFRLLPGPANRFRAEYQEAIAGGTFLVRGEARLAGRVLHALLHDTGSSAPLFFTIAVPGRPANALCGVLAGATIASNDPEPSATRVVLLRSCDPAIAAGNGYLPASALAADLAHHGLAAMAGPVRVLLGDGFEQLGPAEQAALAAAADRSG